MKKEVSYTLNVQEVRAMLSKFLSFHSTGSTIKEIEVVTGGDQREPTFQGLVVRVEEKQ